MQMIPLLEGLTVPGSDHPTTDKPIKLGVNGDITWAGSSVGQWHEDERRITWKWDSLPIIQREKFEGEATNWNSWANSEICTISQTPAIIKRRGDWLRRYPIIDQALRNARIDIEIADKRVLDVGGTGKDIPYFLPYGPSRIDQIEISPISQSVCLAKVQKIDEANGTDVQDRLVLHTVPAEYLPFQDQTFDFIFSRSTIHHCERPRAFAEIARVLKPGGVFILVDRYLSDPGYLAMKLARVIRRVDRGTDDPLRMRELRHAKSLFERFEWHIFGETGVFDYFSWRLNLSTRKEYCCKTWTPGVLSEFFGTQFVAVAQK